MALLNTQTSAFKDQEETNAQASYGGCSTGNYSTIFVIKLLLQDLWFSHQWMKLLLSKQKLEIAYLIAIEIMRDEDDHVKKGAQVKCKF